MAGAKPGFTIKNWFPIFILNSQITLFGNPFFEKTFITELNHQTSLKKNGYKPNPEREALWKSEFFKSFPLTVIAAGHYLSQQQVEKLFDVKKSADHSLPHNKLIIYRSDSRKIIHTRQLSNEVSDFLLKRIVDEMILWYIQQQWIAILENSDTKSDTL